MNDISNSRQPIWPVIFIATGTLIGIGSAFLSYLSARGVELAHTCNPGSADMDIFPYFGAVVYAILGLIAVVVAFLPLLKLPRRDAQVVLGAAIVVLTLVALVDAHFGPGTWGAAHYDGPSTTECSLVI